MTAPQPPSAATAILWVLLIIFTLLWIGHLIRDRCSRASTTPAGVKASAKFQCGCTHDHSSAEDAGHESREGFYAGDPKNKFGTLGMSSKYIGECKDITQEFKTFDQPVKGSQFVVPIVRDMPGEKEPAPVPQTFKFGSWTCTKNTEEVRKKSIKTPGSLFTGSTHGSKNACVVYFVPKGKGILADEAAMKSIKATLASGIEALQSKLYEVTNGHFVLRKVYVAVCEVDLEGRYISYKDATKPYDLLSSKLESNNQSALLAMTAWVSAKLTWDDPAIFTYIMTGTSNEVSVGMLKTASGLGSVGAFASDVPQKAWIKGSYLNSATVISHEILHNLGLQAHTYQDATSIMNAGNGGLGTRLCSLFTYQLGCMNKVKYVSIDKLAGGVTVSSSDLPDATDACAILYVPVIRTDNKSNGASHTDWVPHPVGSVNRRGDRIEVYLYTDAQRNVFGVTRLAPGGAQTLKVDNVPGYFNLNSFIATQDIVNSTLGLQPRPSSISFRVRVNNDYSVTVSAA